MIQSWVRLSACWVLEKSELQLDGISSILNSPFEQNFTLVVVTFWRIESTFLEYLVRFFNAFKLTLHRHKIDVHILKRFGIIATYANVAQSVEQTLRKRPVGGSIPFVGFLYSDLQPSLYSAIVIISNQTHKILTSTLKGMFMNWDVFKDWTDIL